MLQIILTYACVRTNNIFLLYAAYNACRYSVFSLHSPFIPWILGSATLDLHLILWSGLGHAHHLPSCHTQFRVIMALPLFLFYIRSHDDTHRTTYFLLTCPSALNQFSIIFLQLMQHSIFPLFLLDDFTQKYLRPIILISTTLVQCSIILYNAQLSIVYNIFGLTLITPLHFPCPHLVLFITCSSTIPYNLS